MKKLVLCIWNLIVSVVSENSALDLGLPTCDVNLCCHSIKCPFIASWLKRLPGVKNLVEL